MEDEDNPVLLAAYDLLFCSSVPAPSSPVSLPACLLSFISKIKQQKSPAKEGQSLKKGAQADTHTGHATHAERGSTSSSDPTQEKHPDIAPLEVFGDPGTVVLHPNI